jgi:hypothetical protein
MTHVRLTKCRRCGCPEEAHYGPTGRPGACGGDLGPDCPCLCGGFRDRGEDLSDINRHLSALGRQYTRLLGADGDPPWPGLVNVWGEPYRPPDGWLASTAVDDSVRDWVMGSVGVPPDVFLGEPRGELGLDPG